MKIACFSNISYCRAVALRFAMFAMLFGGYGVQASVGVSVDKIVQRYPWNGLVDIDYTVTSDDSEADVYVYPQGLDHDRKLPLLMRTFTGDGATSPVKPGKHRITWNALKDQPNFHSSNFTVTMSVCRGVAPYLVVDISGGATATNYPVRYSACAPSISDDSCRTTNLWLRLIPPGTFMMGSPEGEVGRHYNENGDEFGNETYHQVTITKPFYIGIFEVTQAQYDNIMGQNSSWRRDYDRPVENVSFNTIRGSLIGSDWPNTHQVDNTSFMGVLRSRTGLTFDLPTEAMWEYACRAGTTSALNNGRDLNSTVYDDAMNEVGRYNGNSAAGAGGYPDLHTRVGLYKPNAWGLYDMHGNVCEYCLDWFAKAMGSEAMVDPVGPASGTWRITRGGCSFNAIGNAQNCRSAARLHSGNGWAVVNQGNIMVGFRVVCYPAE